MNHESGNRGIRVLLTRVKTQDGVTLDGIYVPPKRKSKIALIWVHGLGSRFSSGQKTIKELSSALSRAGIGYFKFNNRGHDEVNRDGRGKKKLQGKAFEKFEDCVKDIRAVINFGRRIGFKKFILAGHSTGANKVLYYLSKTKDRSVSGLMMASGLSDISAFAKDIGMRELKRHVRIAERLARKNPILLVPEAFGIFSRARYLSLFQPGRNEDTFPYHSPGGTWKALRNIRVPIAAILGARDEYLDRPAKELIRILQENAMNTKKFSGVIIKGANHGFHKKERELSRAIIDWIKTNN